MNKSWWKILLMVTAVLWTVGLELFFSTHNGPTITWLFVHYVPQTVTTALVSVLVGWIGKHFADAYRKKKEESNDNNLG